MLRRRRVSLLAVVLLLGLVGATPAPSPSPTLRGTRARQLQEVLDVRAAAVRSRDRAAFLGTVDPAGRPFAEAQAAWFDRFGAVPLADYRLEVDDEEDLTRTRDRERYDLPVAVVPVTERLRFEGYGDAPLAGRQFLTFVRRQGRWRVASDTDAEDLGLATTRHPWDFGPVSVHRSDHFLLLVHPAEESRAAELLGQSEQALPDVGRVWHRPWVMRVPVEIPSSPQELEAYLGGGLDVDAFVAFALSSLDPDNGWRWDGSRVVLNSRPFLAQPPAVRRGILAHELVHVASRQARGPFSLTFVEEGLADQAAGSSGGVQLAREVAAGRFDRRLPDDFAFVSGTPDDIRAAYQKASSAFAFLRARFGVDGVDRFYETYGAVRVAPGTARYHADQAFRLALGLSLDKFEQQWADSVAPAR